MALTCIDTFGLGCEVSLRWRASELLPPAWIQIPGADSGKDLKGKSVRPCPPSSTDPSRPASASRRQERGEPLALRVQRVRRSLELGRESRLTLCCSMAWFVRCAQSPSSKSQSSAGLAGQARSELKRAEVGVFLSSLVAAASQTV